MWLGRCSCGEQNWLQRAIPIVLHLALHLRAESLTFVFKMVAARRGETKAPLMRTYLEEEIMVSLVSEERLERSQEAQSVSVHRVPVSTPLGHVPILQLESIEQLHQLQISRLQQRVCELLLRNQELRMALTELRGTAVLGTNGSPDGELLASRDLTSRAQRM